MRKSQTLCGICRAARKLAMPSSSTSLPAGPSIARFAPRDPSRPPPIHQPSYRRYATAATIQNHYAVLSVDQGATRQQIKAKFYEVSAASPRMVNRLFAEASSQARPQFASSFASSPSLRGYGQRAHLICSSPNDSIRMHRPAIQRNFTRSARRTRRCPMMRSGELSAAIVHVLDLAGVKDA